MHNFVVHSNEWTSWAGTSLIVYFFPRFNNINGVIEEQHIHNQPYKHQNI